MRKITDNSVRQLPFSSSSGGGGGAVNIINQWIIHLEFKE